MPGIVIGGRRLAYDWCGEGRAALVFLHEGLGSIRRWRDFPAQLAEASGFRALVFDRYGYGDSDVLVEPRVGTDYMHREALETLPALLSALGVAKPVLVGHSDGASIAIIYAGAGLPCEALVLLAPHVFVEEISVRSIEAARERFETTDMPERLARYHRDPVKTFRLWNDVWLDPEFRHWNIEACLPQIRCPVLAIQGEDDPYGTMAQVDAIARQVRGPCEVVKLADCRHSPHRDQPQRTLAAIVRFLRSLPR